MPNSFGQQVLCDFGNAVYRTRINGDDAYPDIYRCPEVILQLYGVIALISGMLPYGEWPPPTERYVPKLTGLDLGHL